VYRSACGAPRGFALLVVLFSLVFVAFMVTRLAASAHRQTLITMNLRDAALLEAAADGAVAETVFRILARQWPAGALPVVLRETPVRIVVQVTDEGGKIDLNVAPVPLLGGLAVACGADAATAARVAAAIFDWRSPNLPPTPNGAKAPQYRAAGRDYGPPGARFLHPSELGLVLGVSPALQACMGPHVTVYTGAIPAPELADPLIAAVIDNVYPERVNIVLGADYQPKVVGVAVLASTARGTRFSRTAVIRLPMEEDKWTYRVLEWH
jgi:general secretion pathway protein K